MNEDNVRFMKDNGVYMVKMGLEDISKNYPKNKNHDKAAALLREHGIYRCLMFMVDALKVNTAKERVAHFNRLAEKFIELKPDMLIGHFLVPLHGTEVWKEYGHLVTEDDYKHFGGGTAFLERDELKRAKLEKALYNVQYDYLTSDFYNQNIRKFDCGDTLHERFEKAGKSLRKGKSL